MDGPKNGSKTFSEAVAAEAIDQVAGQRPALDKELDTQRGSLRRLNQSLAREASNTSVDSGARSDRIVALQRKIEATEHRLTELAAKRKSCDLDRINADDLRTTLAEFDSIWSSLVAREQEQLIQRPGRQKQPATRGMARQPKP